MKGHNVFIKIRDLEENLVETYVALVRLVTELDEFIPSLVREDPGFKTERLGALCQVLWHARETVNRTEQEFDRGLLFGEDDVALMN